MLKRFLWMSARGPAQSWAGFPLALFFLIIVFYDELSYAIGGAALPSLRTDLSLTYAQAGLLLGLPQVANTFIEPILMLLGDTPIRKGIMLAGGFALGLGLPGPGPRRTGVGRPVPIPAPPAPPYP